MTYKESYMQCKTIEELEDMINKDYIIAKWFNLDKIDIIKQAAEEVIKIKFNSETET